MLRTHTTGKEFLRQKQIRTSLILAGLLALFALRVVGQVLVAFFHVSWLPPMQEWYSGLIPYPALLVCQIAIMLLLGTIVTDLASGDGYFSHPNKIAGRWLLGTGTIYFIGMLLRYAIRMLLIPEARWFGGTIPIFFHCALASCVLALGWYHSRTGADEALPPELDNQITAKAA